MYFRLVDEDVILPSFFAQYGFKNKLCATDVAHATVAILENTVSKVIDCTSRGSVKLL